MNIVLWLLAFAVTLGAATYQRLTGPTHPLRGNVSIDGEPLRYRLIRSGSSSADARVELPDASAGVSGTLHFKRFKTADPFTSVALERSAGRLAAALPRQPAAGKLEYFLTLSTAEDSQRVPAGENETVVIRFKDDVPAFVLIPHILAMFLSILIGMRAGLGALVGEAKTRVLSWVTLGGLTLGGMILGPMVQKYAFGAFWTGFPFGGDLTDNKTLIMWLCWVVACGVLALARREGRSRSSAPTRVSLTARMIVLGAAVVMTIVFLIPHSLRGSELDYDAVDRGLDPSQAIETGR
ncbi:MAG: hypothetical protein JSV80_08145 [Acidobacteriota bacterium]|nr:MAG: hypothetical protein JSV80_08145 [Acidobacteriota bacterium]